MDSAACLKVVVTDLHFVGELLASKDKSNLINHDTLFLLKGLLHLEDGVVGVKVEALLSACQSLYRDLVKERVIIVPAIY